jgi:PAS domain S-box-containing protein
LVDAGLQPEGFWTDVAAIVQSGKPWRGELCNRAKNGTLYWVDTVIAPFFDAQGRIERFVTIRHDITERETAARELQQQRQRLDSILEGTHAGNWEWNVQTGELRINERWAEIVGYAREELQPLSLRAWEDLAHPEDLAASQRLLSQHFAGTLDYYDCEVRMRHRAGHWVWVHARGKLASRTGRGEPEWMAGTHVDVTARKATEAALQQQHALLHGILENLPCGVSVFDGELQLRLHTPQFRTLVGLPDALFAAGPPDFETIIRFNAERGEYGPGDVDAIVAGIVERARSPVPHQFERVRGNGVALEIRGAPLPGGGFVTTYTDVSERRRAEAAVAESEHIMRLVTENIPGRLAYFDRNQGLSFANKATYDFFGGTPETRRGQTFDQMVGDERGDHGRRARKALAGQAQTYDVESLDVQGQQRYEIGRASCRERVS